MQSLLKIFAIRHELILCNAFYFSPAVLVNNEVSIRGYLTMFNHQLHREDKITSYYETIVVASLEELLKGKVSHLITAHLFPGELRILRIQCVQLGVPKRKTGWARSVSCEEKKKRKEREKRAKWKERNTRGALLTLVVRQLTTSLSCERGINMRGFCV